MRKLAAAVSLVVVFVGCVQTQSVKSHTVKRDAQGNIVATEDTETVSQPGSEIHRIHFEHLKAFGEK